MASARSRRLLTVLSVAGTSLALAAPAAAQAESVTVEASRLDNPRGVALRYGDVWVAEAGRGGSGPCLPNPEDPTAQVCAGASGAITRLTDDGAERAATGLPSIAAAGGAAALGPLDVAPARGGLLVPVGLAANPAARAQLGPLGPLFGQLHFVSRAGRVTPVADVAAYEAAANPDGSTGPDGSPAPDTNPTSARVREDGAVVVDAGGNTLLAVSGSGAVSTLAVFPTQLVDAPPFLPVPPGTKIPSQAVPTAVTRGPDGAYYVSQLTGFPFPVGGASVYRVRRGSDPTVHAGGFTNVIDLTFGPDGSLYVLELDANGLLTPGDGGRLVRIRPGGGRSTIADGKLTAPGGLAVSRTGVVWVSNNSTSAGDGELLRIRQ